MNTIVVTGAAGFLGSHLVEKACSTGNKVIGIDNFSTGQRKNVLELQKSISDGFHFIEGDATNTETWKSVSLASSGSSIKTVFHFASPASPPHYQRLGLETMWVNSIGLKNALEFADHAGGRVVFASTSETYGDPLISPQPESYFGNVNTQGPRACYDEAKRFGEALIFTHNKLNKTNHGIVRIFNTYGPRMNPEDGRVIINFLVQGMKANSLSVYGDGTQTRSFCYVDDLVSAIWKFHETKELGPVNIGNDKEFTILELAKEVQGLFPASKLDLEFHPLPENDPKKRRPDLTLARMILSPWAPKVSLGEGLRMMLDWLQGEAL